MIVITAFQETCGSITHVHEQENKRRCVPAWRMSPRSRIHECIRSPPRPALCRKTINHPLLSFEGNSVFITVSHDIWIQCCSELVVGADGKIPRSVTSHAVDPPDRFRGVGTRSIGLERYSACPSSQCPTTVSHRLVCVLFST